MTRKLWESERFSKVNEHSNAAELKLQRVRELLQDLMEQIAICREVLRGERSE